MAADGAVAVLGVLLWEGANHLGLTLLFAQMPGTADDLPGLVEVDAALELTTLLPEDRTTFRYAGSLTTPPCTEGGPGWFVPSGSP